MDYTLPRLALDMMPRVLILTILIFISTCLNAQLTGAIKGRVIDPKGTPLAKARVVNVSSQKSVFADSLGEFEFPTVTYGQYTLLFYADELASITKIVDVNQPIVFLNVQLFQLSLVLDPANVTSNKNQNQSRDYLMPIENFGIFEGKKTEVIRLDALTANLATNNARQVYSQITGLNIWESDGAGLQLGIGGRGLSPNRTANFNVRQNGYDISADALGYPESYYTPPVEALDRIELVRGAASLQFGTQFGGMLNFKFKKGNQHKPIEVVARQSLGSWGFFNSFNSVGGTVAKGKVNYYTYVQYKRGDGFRENAGFESLNAFAGFIYHVNSKAIVELQLTKMNYLAQQPGGLTDRNFEQNPRQSFRDRNWFQVDWNMAALNLTYKFSNRTQLNIRNFGLIAQRNALGNLERINVVDFGGNRTLIKGEFKNIGSETRLLHKYKLFANQHALIIGTRAYIGNTKAMQGDGSSGNNPNFMYLNPTNLENSDYLFQNINYSLFAENIFQLTSKLSITPGVRAEFIQTAANGYYTQRVFDAAGNLVVQNRIDEQLGRVRKFLIAGVGANYKANENLSFYANFTQNYRAINFSDIRIVNPNFRVDANMKDESGFTADIGIKASKENWFNLELTTFLISYKDKIGQILRTDQAPLYLDYRFRGNISDARNVGVEFFIDHDLMSLVKRKDRKGKWTVFANFAYVYARYINSEDNSIEGNFIEMAPPIMLRTGSQFKYDKFNVSFQFAYLSEHYTDATNAIRTSTAVEGLIPAYYVADLSMAYHFKKFGIEASINNLFNQMYFTRRAEGYPGPGIIPADGRGFFLTLFVKI